MTGTLSGYSTLSIVEEEPEEEGSPPDSQRGELIIVLFLGLATFCWDLRWAKDADRGEDIVP